jgi:RNA polymerase sigma factor (TIGR02999 family)
MSAHAPLADSSGERSSDALLAACYADMRRVARAIMARDGMREAMAPTDLVHEAAIRLIRSDLSGVSDRGHLLSIAARSMRQVLIDEVRKARAVKRHVPAMMTIWPHDDGNKLIDIEALDAALAALAEVTEEHARIVELRFSLGLSVAEVVAVTGIPERTVKRRWQAARIWLRDYLDQVPEDG